MVVTALSERDRIVVFPLDARRALDAQRQKPLAVSDDSPTRSDPPFVVRSGMASRSPAIHCGLAQNSYRQCLQMRASARIVSAQSLLLPARIDGAHRRQATAGGGTGTTHGELIDQTRRWRLLHHVLGLDPIPRLASHVRHVAHRTGRGTRRRVAIARAFKPLDNSRCLRAPNHCHAATSSGPDGWHPRAGGGLGLIRCPVATR